MGAPRAPAANSRDNGAMKPNINPDHVINLQGQDYCTYRGVLDCAHALGLEGIRTRILQVPGPDNDYVAIVEAKVRLKDGRVFADVADASPKNVHARLSSALIRMASTRAKGRALRDAVNIGEALVEELGDLDAEQTAHAGHRPPPRAATAPHRVTPPPRTAPAPPAEGDGEAAAAPARPPRRATEEGAPAGAGPAPAPTTAQAAMARDQPAPETVVEPQVATVPVEAPSGPDQAASEAPAGESACSGCGRTLTQGQYDFSVRSFGASLCPACQRKQSARGRAA